MGLAGKKDHPKLFWEKARHLSGQPAMFGAEKATAFCIVREIPHSIVAVY